MDSYSTQSAMTASKLEIHLTEYDGKAVSLLSEARAMCQTSPDYIEELITLCADPRPVVSDGATWILKAELEDGLNLSPDLTQRLVGALDNIQSWAASLHLCQSVERLSLTSSQADHFLEWARGFADHPRPFLRAWSLHARVVLGRETDRHHAEAEEALRKAETDKAASVRARARQLRTLMASPPRQSG